MNDETVDPAVPARRVWLEPRELAAVAHFVRRLILFGALVAVGVSGLVLLSPRAAFACSCGPPPPLVTFEGTVQADSGPPMEALGRDYEFAVDDVVSGDVHRAETVRVFTDDSGGSCAVGPRLAVRRRYRVSAYVSTMPNGSRLLFVTACGGKVEPVVASSPAPSSDSRVPLLGAAAALAGVTAGAVLWRKRRS